MRAIQGRLASYGAHRRLGEGRRDLVKIDAIARDVVPAGAEDGRAVAAGDLRGRTVEGRHALVLVENDEARADTVEDEIAEGFEVTQVAPARLELPMRRAVALGDAAHHDRDDEEGRRVQEDGDDLERRRLQGRLEEVCQRKDGPPEDETAVQQGGERGDREDVDARQERARTGHG